MLPLLKKKSDAGQAGTPAAQAWHPNFRNFAALPDVKVVRTAFFVNVAAISVVTMVGAYYGFTEWSLRSVNLQVDEMQRRIDTDKKKSDQAVALFKKFQGEEAKVVEVDTFLKSRPLFSSLLVRLGQTLPKDVAIDMIELREKDLTLRITLRGSPQQASGLANTYLEQLKADAELSRYFEEFMFTGTPTREAASGRLTAEFLLKLRPTPLAAPTTPPPAPGGAKK